MHVTSKALSVLREPKPLSMKCNTSPMHSNKVDNIHENVDQNCVGISSSVQRCVPCLTFHNVHNTLFNNNILSRKS